MHLNKLIIAALLLSSCATPMNSNREVASTTQPLIQTLPKITTDNGELLAGLKKSLKNRTKGKSDAELTAAAVKLRDYLLFLGLSARDLVKSESSTEVDLVEKKVPLKVKGVNGDDDDDTGGEDTEEKTPSNLKAIQRLFIASTQFLDCPVMTDWECLEKSPVFPPTADFRIEKSDVTTAVNAGSALDMDVFFTEGWDGSPRGMVSERFAEKINKDSTKSLSLAMYGIDDIDASMSNVYQAIINRSKTKANVRAVVDVMGFERGATPWVFNYVDQPQFESEWLFGQSTNPENPNGMHMTFQYDGTPSFIREMNEGITNQDQSRVRLEWSTARIMHNKFAVMENSKGQKSVWTGTANISKNCMGVEANANMSVYIRNDAIATAYLDQFNLMFNFDKTIEVKSKQVRPVSAEEPSLVGRFHRAKYPVNKRYFTFGDGTKLRVHFAPTDDAEHRSIIPMLLSAKKGDQIRISMFGGTGYELVRAMQYAAAKGADVKIAFDRRLGHGLTSWIRDSVLNVNMENPYANKFENVGVTPGKISYRVSTWSGKNHYKAGTLTRRLGNGKMLPEQIIVGSQNWSSGGNDFNDENLISIQNLNYGVKAAEMFNTEFDTRLWVNSKEEAYRPAKTIY